MVRMELLKGKSRINRTREKYGMNRCGVRIVRGVAGKGKIKVRRVEGEGELGIGEG